MKKRPLTKNFLSFVLDWLDGWYTGGNARSHVPSSDEVLEAVSIMKRNGYAAEAESTPIYRGFGVGTGDVRYEPKEHECRMLHSLILGARSIVPRNNPVESWTAKPSVAHRFMEHRRYAGVSFLVSRERPKRNTVVLNATSDRFWDDVAESGVPGDLTPMLEPFRSLSKDECEIACLRQMDEYGGDDIEMAGILWGRNLKDLVIGPLEESGWRVEMPKKAPERTDPVTLSWKNRTLSVEYSWKVDPSRSAWKRKPSAGVCA